MSYEPPSGYKVGLTFVNGYVVPAGYKVGLEFSPTSGPVGDNQYLFPQSFDALAFGEQHIKRATEWIALQGIVPPAISTQHSAQLYTRYITPAGFNQSAVGRPSLRNWNFQAFPAGIVATLYGRPTVWNLRQYVTGRGFASQLFGTASVLGGVKYVYPGGIAWPGTGNTVVINTTANKYAYPQGMPAPAVPAPNVSPRTIRVTGFLAGQAGIPLVQPNPSPKGFVTDGYGTPDVIYKTRWVKPASVYDFDAGYPVVRDKAQTVLHKSSPVTSIFGDTSVKLKNFFIRPTGHSSLEFSSWAELRNQNRYVNADGFTHWTIGDSSISNKWPTVAPQGWNSAEFGTHNFGWRIREVRPTGIALPFSQVDKPSLWQTPSLKPAGIAPPAITKPTVWAGVRVIEQIGSNMQRFGEASVDFSYRFIKHEGSGVNVSAYGTHRVENGIRELIASGRALDQYGTPWVSFGQRYVTPDGIYFNFATRHMVGGLRYIAADGFNAARFGTRIIPESQTVYASGFVGAFGLATAINRKLFIKPDGFTTFTEPKLHWGNATLFNKKRYITQNYDVDSELNPPRWPQWTAIENRNKVMGAIGNNELKSGRPFVYNNARGIYPVGMPPSWITTRTDRSMIADRIRFLKLEGMESPYISSWASVNNKAVLLKPNGYIASLFGTAHIESNRREFKRIGNLDSAVLGYPFVAPAIREILLERRYSIAPPIIRLPTVDLHTRYIEDAGGFESNPSNIGRASLSIHWNIIAPRWNLQHFFGYPVLKNLTPEVVTRGRNAEDFGSTLVRLQWRGVTTAETFTQVFGRTMIADTRRVIYVSGLNAGMVSDKLKVVRTGAPPYSEQNIIVELGIEEPKPQVSNPSMNQQVVYVLSASPQTKFGNTEVKSNSLRPVGISYELDAVSRPDVSLLNRMITVKGDAGAPIEPPAPRLSPHTIWAVKEAPQQAKDNHEPRQLHYVGETFNYPYYGPGERFGTQRVENYHRSISARGSAHGSYGTASIINKRSYVTVKGMLMLRMGWPGIPGNGKVQVYASIYSMLFGKPSVAYGPYLGPQTIKPAGMAVSMVTATRVEHFHRELLAKGRDSMAMGTWRPGENPYQWQGLRIGELMPTIPTGFENAEYGTCWVSLRVRELQLEGYDAFACEYDPTMFAQRMRVKRPEQTLPDAQRILTQGDEYSGFGYDSIHNHTHFIRPDGNSDQHRKGAW